MSAQTPKEPTEADVAAYLEGLDAGGVEIPANPLDGPAPAQAESPETEADESEQGQSSDEIESPEAGTESEEPEAEAEETKDKATEKQPNERDATEKQPEPAKTQSKFEKAQARQAEAWKKIEAEKAAIKAERDAIEKAKAEQAQRAAKEPEPVRDTHGFTAKDYEAYAEQAERENQQLKQEGEEPKYTQANIELARVRAQALKQQEQLKAQETSRAAAEATVQETLKKYPDLQKPDSPLHKAMKSVWEQEQKDGFYSRSPDGFSKMAEVAAYRAKADSVPALEKRITELTKENERLTKLTSPSKGGATPATKGPKNDSIPTEAELEAWAAEMDNAGVPVG